MSSANDWDNFVETVARELVSALMRALGRKELLNLIANLTDDCVKDLNEEKRSLGIVKPVIKECYFCPEENYDPFIQKTLFGPPPPKSKKQYREFPKIKYSCPICKMEKPHDQTVLEWGFYEWFRKHPDNIEQVWENALLDSPNHEVFFFVGNMLRYRNAFLIISILRLPKGPVSKSLVPLKKWD